MSSYGVQLTKHQYLKATFSMSQARSASRKILTIIIFRLTDFALERSVLINVLLEMEQLNNSTCFYFSLSKVEAKPASKYFGFESLI